MLVLCLFCVPLLCWPNYGMWYLGPNRFTMMLVCGKTNVKKVLEFNSNFWPRVHSRSPIPDSSVHYPFYEVANRWRWLIVKAMVIWTRHIWSKTLAVILGLVYTFFLFYKEKLFISIDRNYVATRSTWVPCSFFFIRFENHASIRTGNSTTFLPLATTLDDCVSAYRLHFMQFAPMKNIKIAKTRLKSLSVSIARLHKRNCQKFVMQHQCCYYCLKLKWSKIFCNDDNNYLSKSLPLPVKLA